MTEIQGEIYQFKSRGGAFINTLRDLREGGVGMWGSCFQKPTYLFINSYTWFIVSFDDNSWRDHWMPILIKLCDPATILELPDMKPYEVEK